MTGAVAAVRRARGRVAEPRTLALSAALVLTASYVRVLYRVADVAGDVRWLLVGVLAALAFATATARLAPARAAVGLGAVVLLAGLSAYALQAPAVRAGLADLSLVDGVVETLLGDSVLEYQRAGTWAVAVAPAPVFLTWLLAVRGRYDRAVAVGGLTLGFFVLSGDAGEAVTLAGVVAGLGALALGGLERAGATRALVERLGLALALVVLASRLVDLFGPAGRAPATDGAGGDGSGPLVSAARVDDDVDVRTHVTLDPAVQFAVTADRPAAWQVAAFDRYTGDGWVATGGATPLRGRRSGPPGPTERLRQRVAVETDLSVLPAAWKPVAVEGGPGDAARATEGGLRPGRPLAAGTGYVVESEVPAADPDRLRAAGTAYPPAVADRYLGLPASTPARLGRRAREIAGDAPTPYDAAVAVEDWLEATKEYSVTARDGGTTAADSFVFGQSAGYCVHFATAMAVLLRSLDVPTRVVAGFTPGERVGEREWVVRGADSHVWVQVYFPGVGWTAFDPTPERPRRAAEAAGAGPEARASDPGHATPRPWNGTGDSGPGPTAPDASNRSGSPGAPAGPPDPDRRLRELVTEARPVGPSGGGSLLAGQDRVALLAGAAALLLGVSRLGLLRRAGRALLLYRQSPTDSPAADAERAYRRVEAALARQARPRREEETAREYLAAVGAGPRARRVARVRERARHAGRVTRDGADEAIRAADAVVREAGRSRTSTRRPARVSRSDKGKADGRFLPVDE